MRSGLFVLNFTKFMRGLTKYDLEDYEGAIGDLTNLLNSDPYLDPEEYAEALFYIGAAKLNLEDYGGCADINQAVERVQEAEYPWADSIEVNFCAN